MKCHIREDDNEEKSVLKVAATVAAIAALPGAALAQEVTLRLHQFLPPVATVPAKILKPWGEKVAAASGDGSRCNI